MSYIQGGSYKFVDTTLKFYLSLLAFGILSVGTLKHMQKL